MTRTSDESSDPSAVGAALRREFSRRRALALGAGGTLGLSGLLGALETLRSEPALAEPSLTAPAEAVRATMTAYADTIVPGPAGGADSDPGAVEADVVSEIYRSFYGLGATFPLLHADIQAATPRVLGRLASFDLDLPYADREKVVQNRITELPDGGTNPLAIGYQAAGIVIYFTYYGVASSKVGPRVIGFPPSSDGYPDHSYGVRFRGMTSDGNPS